MSECVRTMDNQSRLEVCGIIAGVLISDDHLHPQEANFLRRMRERFDIPDDELVEPMAHEEAVAKLRDLSPELRGEVLPLVVEAAAADGRIDIGERVFLDALAKELSVAQDDLDKLLVEALDEKSPSN